MQRMLTCMLGALLVCTGTACARDGQRPHIVVLILDTLRADRLGCYGFEPTPSPELDELAAQGVRFAHTISQTSWTRPSIASMLTSLHPRTLGMYDERGEILADRFETLAEILSAHGYRTVGATANPHLNPAYNFQQGFDHYLGTAQLWGWMLPTRGQTATPTPRLPTSRELLARVLEIRDAGSRHDRARPHYVQVNLMDVHQAEARPELIHTELRELFSDVEPELERVYLRGVRQVSVDVAAFVDAWSGSPGFEDTLFVIVSDHGQGLASHPAVPGGSHRHHGFYLYESQLRVPWILFHPGDRLPRGLTIERPVRLLELMPTVLELAGIEHTGMMAGRSLAPLLRGGPAPELPEHFVVETQFMSANKTGLYTKQWKYFENRDNEQGLNPRALHATGVMGNGLETDVGSQHPELLARFAAELASWEAAHPKRPPVLRDGLSTLEQEQLRSLGYLQ